MYKQVIKFLVTHDLEKGVVEKIGKSIIKQPETNFKGGSVKWYEDKDKQETTELQNRDAEK